MVLNVHRNHTPGTNYWCHFHSLCNVSSSAPKLKNLPKLQQLKPKTPEVHSEFGEKAASATLSPRAKCRVTLLHSGRCTPAFRISVTRPASHTDYDIMAASASSPGTGISAQQTTISPQAPTFRLLGQLTCQ